MKTVSIFLLLIVSIFATSSSRATIQLPAPRVGHTATRLYSGLVLIAGGTNETETLQTALLYNPATGKFTATGPMTVPRAYHVATLLGDGRVLLTGGSQGATKPLLSSAEIYDPASGTFTAASHLMSVPRENHTATLLKDGFVVIVGGKTADLFNPTTQVFSEISNPPTNRTNQAAVLLDNGTVLITGGYVDNLPSAEAWIYDPTTNKFTLLVAKMLIPRANQGMSLLLSGKVLVTCGFSGTSPHDECDIYDPVAQVFSSTRHMFYHRSNQEQMTLPNGKVLVVGGTTLESGFLFDNEIYDPVGGTWSIADTMQQNRSGATATLLDNGDVFVVGGVTGNTTLQTAEILSPTTHVFTRVGDMSVPRNQHTETLLPDGTVLLAAGSTDFDFLSSAEVFNPSTNSFSTVGSLSIARKSHTATLLSNSMVLIAGGKSAIGDLASAELYNPSTKTFSQTNPMNNGRSLHTATLLNNGQVLIAGGREGATPIKTTELFNPTTNTFAFTGSLNVQRKRHAANLLLDGTVMVEGGASESNGVDTDAGTPTAEVYSSTTGIWTQVGNMSTGRTEQTATRLDDGTVLVAGGISVVLPSDLYHPILKTFSTVDGLIQPRQRHVALLLSNSAWGSLTGKVLEIGGASTGSSVFGGLQNALDTVEIYDPATAQFSLFGHMTQARQNHTATMLNDGRILIAGGVSSPAISQTAETLPFADGTPTPAPILPGNLLNISTRLNTGTGDDNLIAGFIITGGTTPKTVYIRALGPSLKLAKPPVTDALADPVLELHKPDGTVITNDDWRDTQQAEIQATGIPPTANAESAIIAQLSPADPTNPASGAYTAIVRGKNNTTGVTLLEVYDLDAPEPASQLANISSRGFVGTGDDVIIGGFIIGPTPPTGEKILVRAIGPSLAGQVTDPLANPYLQVFDENGTRIAANDNWQTPNGPAISATGLAPRNRLESAVLLNNPAASNYTAIVDGAGGGTGVALVEVYHLN